MQAGSLSGLLLVVLRFVEIAFRRVRLEVAWATFLRTTPDGKTLLDATLTVRNRGQRSTSIEGVYFEWSGLTGLRYGLFRRRQPMRSMRGLQLVEVETGPLPPPFTEEKGKRKQVSLPIRIIGGDTRNFCTLMDTELGKVEVRGREVIPREYRLVMETTHKKYVKELDFKKMMRVARMGPLLSQAEERH